MRTLWFICWAALMLLYAWPMSGPAQSRSRKIFHIRDYGALPNSQADAGPALRAAVQAALRHGGPAEVVLDGGEYRIRPERRESYCVTVSRARDLTIRGQGAATRLVVTAPDSGALMLTDCVNVGLSGLTIDYDPVPFCQGTIRAVDEAAGSFDLEVDTGYPTPDAPNFVNAAEPYGKWGMIMDRSVRRIRALTPDHYMTPKWEHLGGRVWRFYTASEHYRLGLRHMRVGDAYVHLARGYGSAVLAQACEGVLLERLTVHASPGLVVGLVANRGAVVVRRLEVRFPRGSDRLLTANADGVHCQQNRAGPLIERCYFEGMADDGVNLYAPPNVLREVIAPTEWLVSAGCHILPGDRLQVMDPRRGEIRGEVVARTVQPERGGLRLTVDRSLDGMKAGENHLNADTLYNLSACGAGFKVLNNTMNGNRRYGVLVRAGDGLIEGNRFLDTTGAGVVLTNEPDWPEGPAPWSVVIRGNTFVRGGTCLGYADWPMNAALAIRAVKLGHAVAEAEAIRDVRVEGNTFLDRAGCVIFVGGVRGAVIARNRVTASPNTTLRRSGAVIEVTRSSGVRIVDNSVEDKRQGTTAVVEIHADSAPGEAGVSVARLRAALSDGKQAVVDRRTGAAR